MCSRLEWLAGKVSDFIISILGTLLCSVYRRESCLVFSFLRILLSQKTILSLGVNLPEAYPPSLTVETYFASRVTITFVLKQEGHFLMPPH